MPLFFLLFVDFRNKKPAPIIRASKSKLLSLWQRAPQVKASLIEGSSGRRLTEGVLRGNFSYAKPFPQYSTVL